MENLKKVVEKGRLARNTNRSRVEKAKARVINRVRSLKSHVM